MPIRTGNTIDVSYETGEMEKRALSTFVKAYVESVLGQCGVRNSTLGISFVSDETIRSLNNEYRGKDEPTDILSFAQCDGIPFPSKKKVLGDMVISQESMKRNCVLFSVSEEEELKRLLIHGCLHLTGHDHATNDVSCEPMLQLQEKILTALR